MPHPHLIATGTSVNSCLSTTNWAASAGTLSLTTPPDTRYGTQPCVKLTSDVNTAAGVDLTINQTLTGRMGFLVYLDAWDTDAGSVQNNRTFTIYVSNDSLYANHYFRAVQLHVGWNYITIGRATQVTTSNEECTWRSSGSPSWANAMVRIRFRVEAQAGTTHQIYIRAIRDGDYHKPQIILDFDDQRSTVYTSGFPVMQALGLKGSMNVIGDKVGVSNYMTEAQLQELYDAGWDLCNHTLSHVQNSYKAGTYEYCLAEIVRCENYLAAKGWTRRNCHKHFAAPFGESTFREASAYRQAIKDQCFTGRTTQERSMGPYVADPVLVNCMIPDGAAETLANQYERIQAAIGTGSVIRFLFHNLDGTSAQTSWTVANFTSLMQYIARLRDGGVIDVPTWTEWYEQVKDERVPVATS